MEESHSKGKYLAPGEDSDLHKQKETKQIEILLHFFETTKNYCVGLVDMVDSTSMTMKMSNEQVGRYYGMFLNMMAEIVSSFEGIVVKNIGDSLLYYFPKTDSGNPESFRDVLRCCFAMINVGPLLNARMKQEGLPQISYRISCEYGSVVVGKMSTSSVNDIFGHTVNMCSKINALALPNGIVIGEGLYQKVKSLDGYTFTEKDGGSEELFQKQEEGRGGIYRVYLVADAFTDEK